MALKRISKIAAVAMSAIMLSEAGLTSFVPLTVEAREKEETVIEEVVNASGSSDNFTWDNATVYFVLTDRFYNGDKSNDHSYGRSEGEVDADQYETRAGTFHGSDLVGLTQKIEEGYFDDLGVNAIWISAPYEQIHGAVCGNGFKHYAYHGYYPLDFSNMDANMGTEEEMKKFVEKDKLSKKAKKKLSDEKRIRWEFAPISRIIPNKKKEAEKKIRMDDQ